MKISQLCRGCAVIGILVVVLRIDALIADCNELRGRGSCEEHNCDWRKGGDEVLSPVGYCENKDDVFYAPNVKPFRRYGKQHTSSSLNRFLCVGPVVGDLGDDPCYGLSMMNIDQCACNGEIDSAYAISQPQGTLDRQLNPGILRNHTMFVFIHVNKAAGETLKSIAYNTLQFNRWDGVGYGTRFGWQFMEGTFPNYNSNYITTGKSRRDKQNIIESSGLTEINRGKIMYAQCGDRFSTFEQVNDHVLNDGKRLNLDPTGQESECALRYVWGNAAMGLCDHFPGMPCVYFIALRDPLSRALSDYFYFCVDGAEGRKKWTDEMLAKGECSWGPLQWFKTMRTSPYFYQERLTRGCDASCGVDIALNNLFHPCMRYILVEEFQDGLNRLKAAFAPAFDLAVDSFLASPKRVNKRGHGMFKGRLKSRVISNSTLETLKEWLKEDYLIYNEAVRRYEEQWAKPLESCNDFRL